MILQPFLLALQFLTRLPVPGSDGLPDEEVQARAVLYYPLVGLVIGLVLVLLFLLTDGLGSLLQAALLLSLWVAITGALHIDGLADTADAWIGGQGDPERTLEIMKDTHAGPMAVTAVVLVLLVKFAALETLLDAGNWSALLLAPLVGRSGLVAALGYMPYVRPGGLGSVLSEHLSRERSQVVLLVSALFCSLFLGWGVLLLLLLVVGCFALLRSALMERIGGVTGDAAGAICELLEVTALLAMAFLV
ncbi:MAG: adenosylcobinamide-GDP ribazoletransferase [Sedimenticola sp.]